MIQQLLDFSRQRPTEQRLFNLPLLLKGMEKLLRGLLPENIQLKMHLETEEAWIQGNPGGMEQIVANLVANSRDAMPKGGVLEIRFFLCNSSTVPFEISTPQVGVLEVKDTGIGIPEEILPHIFEPFFTTKQPGKGTGLGLAQVYGLVKQQGGYIQVKSEVGKETVFSLFFPLCTPSSQKATPAFASSPPRHLKSQPCVLLVEEDPEVLKTLERMLDSLGCLVISAQSGQEAIFLFRKHKERISFILTDIVMPDIEGEEVVREILKISPPCPIYCMTGDTEAQLSKELQTKIQGLLEKPIPLEKLAAILSSVTHSR